MSTVIIDSSSAFDAFIQFIAEDEIIMTPTGPTRFVAASRSGSTMRIVLDCDAQHHIAELLEMNGIYGARSGMGAYRTT